MTVYKAIKKEADAAAKLAIALAKGETPTVSDTVNNGNEGRPVGASRTPVAVTKDNIKDYIGEPDFPTQEDICAGKLAVGLHRDRASDARRGTRGGTAAPGPRPLGGGEDFVTDAPVLELRGVSKRFGAVQALYEVDFHVAAGEVMALVGDNGAGKSTLIKCIAGIYPFDDGEIVFDGQPVNIHGPKDAAQLGIEVVYQDLALADNLDVVQNMFLGREATDGASRASTRPTMEAQAHETLKSLSVTTLRSVRQTVAGLSGGQRQSVAVAKAVMWNSRVVILDEPTAALGVAQTRPGARPRQAPRRAGPRGDPDLAQPARHLRGRRQHHRAAPRPERGRVQAHGDDPAGGRRGDHRRQAVEGARPGGGRRMSTVAERRLSRRPTRGRTRDARRTTRARWWTDVKSGELGSLPIIVGLIIIAIVFQSQNSNFLTAGNFVNLIVQTAAYRAHRDGHHVRAAARRDRPVGRLRLRRRPASSSRCCCCRTATSCRRSSRSSLALGAGLAIGTFHGLLITKIGIPSFVVTLAGLLAWNGVVLLLIGSRGTVILQNDFVDRPRQQLPHGQHRLAARDRLYRALRRSCSSRA